MRSSVATADVGSRRSYRRSPGSSTARADHANRTTRPAAGSAQRTAGPTEGRYTTASAPRSHVADPRATRSGSRGTGPGRSLGYATVHVPVPANRSFAKVASYVATTNRGDTAAF